MAIQRKAISLGAVHDDAEGDPSRNVADISASKRPIERAGHTIPDALEDAGAIDGIECGLVEDVGLLARFRLGCGHLLSSLFVAHRGHAPPSAASDLGSMFLAVCVRSVTGVLRACPLHRSTTR